MYRTHTCGQITKENLDQTVKLAGWVNIRRDHGGVIFIDLRDKYGITQTVFYPECADFKDAEHLRREDVIQVEGKVVARKDGMENKKLITGEVELVVDKLKILNKSEVPPIEIDDRKVANDELRLEYRYLDLRRPQMQKNLVVRHKASMAARNFLSQEGFLEIETPTLIKPTPEGARDFTVPSRINKGKFYSLPQSPQIYKQILMVSGCDKYFQLARCYRDEDLRADRQPEFTQIDVEGSFVDGEDMMNYAEDLSKCMMKEAIGVEIKDAFQRMPYDEAMEKYGSDKPDLRYGLELTDVSQVVKDSDFGVFKSVVENGGVVKVINPETTISRKMIDKKYIPFAQQNGAKGMAWMHVTEEGTLDSNIVKYFNEEVKAKLLEVTGAKPGTTLFFIADTKNNANATLDKIRRKLADDLDLYDKNEFKFLWITDFPFFEWDDEKQDYIAAHHMFTMPKEECLDYLETDKSKVYAKCYDLVLNGVELSSGSVRIHDKDVQKRVMKAMNISEEEAQDKFGFLLKAFEFGAPPHAGFGIGLARLVSIMCGTDDIRDVIAFPKNKSMESPMDNSPSPADDAVLKDLAIKIDLPKEEENKE